MIRKRFTLLLN